MAKHDLLLCETDFARFWCDKPEDCLALYRELMSSPTFAVLHAHFCSGFESDPRLAAWTDQDGGRIPLVWSNFVQEICLSTNPLLRVEGRLFEFVEARSEARRGLTVDSSTDLATATLSAKRVRERRDRAAEAVLTELLATNHTYGAGQTASPYVIAPEVAEALTGFNELGPEYHRRREPLDQGFAVLEQKRFLANDTTFDSSNIFLVFRQKNYSPDQARELQPLLVAYKSNLVALLRRKLRQEGFVNSVNCQEIERVEARVRQVLGLPQLPSAHDELLNTWRAERRAAALSAQASPSSTNIAQLQRSAGLTASSASRARWAPQQTNAGGNSVGPFARRQPSTTPGMRQNEEDRAEALITTARFHKIPILELMKILPQGPKPTGARRLSVEGHRVVEGKVWFDVRYAWGTNGRAAAAVWDPSDRNPVVSSATLTNGWRIIPYPGEDDTWSEVFGGGSDESINGVHFEMFKGSVYLSVWHQAMRRFRLQSNVWETLPIPVDKPTQLFALRDRLFAANDESIYEILDDGQRTHLLASCRRRPPASALDSLESLGTPILFPGPRKTLRASIGSRVYTWNNRDWTEVFSLPSIALPVVFDEGIIFRSAAPPTASFWFLEKDGSKPELYWQQEWRRKGQPLGMRGNNPTVGASSPAQTWQALPNVALGSAAVLSDHSKLYFLASHLDRSGQPDSQADLICLQRGNPRPLSIPIRLPPGFQLVLDSPYERRFPWMASLPGTLLIGQPGLGGVVTIAWRDIEVALAAERARLPR